MASDAIEWAVLCLDLMMAGVLYEPEEEYAKPSNLLDTWEGASFPDSPLTYCVTFDCTCGKVVVSKVI